MKKQEFLQMMLQDNETEQEPKKTLFADVIDCMDIALSQTPDTFEISADKTLQGAWALIEKRGNEKRSGNNTPCVGPFEAAEIIAEYLGTKYERASKRLAVKPAVSVNLDDFI